MKRIGICCILILCFILSSCGFSGITSEGHLKLKSYDPTVLDEYDSHGGFHGDGSYRLILDCSENAEEVRKIVESWTPLPLSRNLQYIMSQCNSEAHWQEIKNGVYKFEDRHSEAKDRSDDSEILNRYSFNFSIAAYDLDSDILYYFEMDT